MNENGWKHFEKNHIRNFEMDFSSYVQRKVKSEGIRLGKTTNIFAFLNYNKFRAF